jgi:hypothetical protein
MAEPMALNWPNANIFCSECGARPHWRGDMCACVSLFDTPNYKAMERLAEVLGW